MYGQDGGTRPDLRRTSAVGPGLVRIRRPRMRHANCVRREATTRWDSRRVDQTFRKTSAAPSPIVLDQAESTLSQLDRRILLSFPNLRWRSVGFKWAARRVGRCSIPRVDLSLWAREDGCGYAFRVPLVGEVKEDKHKKTRCILACNRGVGHAKWISHFDLVRRAVVCRDVVIPPPFMF
jgi:hypothetical protein